MVRLTCAVCGYMCYFMGAVGVYVIDAGYGCLVNMVGVNFVVGGVVIIG